MTHSLEIYKNWFSDNPDITHILAGIFDFNGVLRGKIMPVSKLESLLTSGLKMPQSIQILDIFGHDIEDSHLVFATGDRDATAYVTGRLPVRLPHLSQPTALLVMYFRAGKFPPEAIISPHEMLMTDNYDRHGVVPLLRCGVEMEFMLLASHEAAPAPSLATAEVPKSGQILSALHLDDYSELFTAISDLCHDQSIIIDTITSEAGIGQFEVTFQPKTELSTVAEDILIFKYMVKALAKSYGVKACFMAKPIEGQPGNGMHIHASLINSKTKANLFDEEAYGKEGEATLLSAIGGLLSSMKEASLILAPHMNSYRRFSLSSHAPVNICWGYDNRTAAVRVPASDSKARRIEMRVAGADANPYFVLTWLYMAITKGVLFKKEAPEPVIGNAYDQSYDRLATNMAEALMLAKESNWLANEAINLDVWLHYLATKSQEYERFAAHVPPFEFETLSEQL